MSLPPPLPQALAYIDREYETEEVRAEVQALIAAEVQAMSQEGLKPRDYLRATSSAAASMPQLKLSLLLQQELERVSQHRKQTPLDTSRYDLEPPSGPLAEDAQAWKRAVSNAKVMHSHQENRLLNLQLLDQYGSKAWLAHNNQLEGIQKRLEHAVKTTSDAVEEVNLKRKTGQKAVVSVLYNTHVRTQATLAKAIRLRSACDELEAQVKRLRVEAQEKGLEPIPEPVPAPMEPSSYPTDPDAGSEPMTVAEA